MRRLPLAHLAIHIAAFAFVFAVAGAPGAARAVGVPGSALARSLQMHPSLVDSPAQAFEHPQRTVLGASSVATLDTGEYNEPGAVEGVLLIRDRVALAAGSQRTTAELDFSTEYARSARAAVRLGPFRIGAAYRRSSSTEDSEREYAYIRSDDTVDRQVRRFRSTFLLEEHAAGLGWSRGRASVDLTGEMAFVDATDAYRLEDTGRANEGTEVELDTDPLWGGSLLAEVPLDARTTMTAVASFRDRRSAVDLRILNPYQIWVTFEQPTYGHRWNAHLAFERAARVGSVTVHGGYTDWRGPSAEASLEIEYTQRRTETTETGLALQRPGWWDTTLYAGIRAYRSRTWREWIRIDPEYRNFTRDNVMEEVWGQSFAWGAARTIGDLDLVGVVTTDLRVGDPLMSLDARFRF